MIVFSLIRTLSFLVLSTTEHVYANKHAGIRPVLNFSQEHLLGIIVIKKH